MADRRTETRRADLENAARLSRRLHLLYDSPIHVEPLAQVKLHRLDQHAGFKSLSCGDDVLQRPARSDVKASLGNDRTFVQAHRHEMRSDADDFHALLVSLTVGLRPRKTGQQRWVYVDDFIFVAPDKDRGESIHEPCMDKKENCDVDMHVE